MLYLRWATLENHFRQNTRQKVTTTLDQFGMNRWIGRGHVAKPTVGALNL